MSRKASSLPLAALVTLATFPVIVVALHLVQSGSYHPVSEAVSELALGHAGWLMAIAFCSTGLGTLLLARILRNIATRPRLAPVLLSLAGALSFISAFVHADPEAATTTSTHGAVHQAAGVLTFILIVAAMFSLARVFRCDRPWRPLALPTCVWSIVSVPAFMLIPVSGSAHFGLAQRVFLTVLFSWMLAVAFHAYRIARAGRPIRVQAAVEAG